MDGNTQVKILYQNKEQLISLRELYKLKPTVESDADSILIYDYPDITDEIFIESEHGWSRFGGVICRGKQKIIGIKEYKLKCTPEHKLYIDNQWIKAEELSHIKYKNMQTVYDILNIDDNNAFYVYTNDKKLLVHNCLILDEFAFIAPSCILGDGKITLRNTETNEIKEYTIEEAHSFINNNN